MVFEKTRGVVESFLPGQDVEHWRTVYPLALVDIIVLVEQVTVDPDVGSVVKPVGLAGVAESARLVVRAGAESNDNPKLAVVPGLEPDTDALVYLDVQPKSAAGKFAEMKHEAGPQQVLDFVDPNVVELQLSYWQAPDKIPLGLVRTPKLEHCCPGVWNGGVWV
jgi:hypothetical protein